MANDAKGGRRVPDSLPTMGAEARQIIKHDWLGASSRNGRCGSQARRRDMRRKGKNACGACACINMTGIGHLVIRPS